MCVQKSHHMDMYGMPCPFRPIMLRSRSIKLGDKNSQLHQISQSWTTHIAGSYMMLNHACMLHSGSFFPQARGILLWRFIWNGDKAVTRAFRVSRKYNPVRPLQKCGQSAGVWSLCQADLAPHGRLQRPTAVWRVRKSGKQQPNLAPANQTQQPPPPSRNTNHNNITEDDADKDRCRLYSNDYWNDNKWNKISKITNFLIGLDRFWEALYCKGALVKACV